MTAEIRALRKADQRSLFHSADFSRSDDFFETIIDPSTSIVMVVNMIEYRRTQENSRGQDGNLETR